MKDLTCTVCVYVCVRVRMCVHVCYAYMHVFRHAKNASVLVTSFITVTKIPVKSSLKKEGFILVPSLRVQSIVMGKAFYKISPKLSHRPV